MSRTEQLVRIAEIVNRKVGVDSSAYRLLLSIEESCQIAEEAGESSRAIRLLSKARAILDKVA